MNPSTYFLNGEIALCFCECPKIRLVLKHSLAQFLRLGVLVLCRDPMDVTEHKPAQIQALGFQAAIAVRYIIHHMIGRGRDHFRRCDVHGCGQPLSGP
jgi:hypothetical protein